MADLFDLVAKLTLDSSEYSSGLDSALGKAKSIGGTIAKVGTAAVGAAAAGIVAFGKSSVEAGMNFDSSMSQVAATMGTTVGEISELRDFAQEMGSTTAFSATQAADALNYMALAGYDAETSMQMLPNVLNLAAAGGIELASASDMVTDAQSALGLSLDETSELVDKMAKASSKSNTSVAQLGDAILTVGGTAKNLAGGTTELSTALGILADNGIKGAEGGTALRNIILSLSAPTDVAAKKMQSLGLSAYDAEGNLRPLEDIFGDLNETLSTMTQGEQTEVLNTLFNKVDLKSANALLATSKTRWKDLSKEINNASGAAKKMADTQLDNLAGDITLFKSALEGAQIAISDSLSPTLRGFVQDASEGVSRLTEAFKSGGLTAAMEEAGDVLSGMLTRVVDTAPKVVEGAIGLIGNIGKGLVDNADQIFDAALRIADSLTDGIANALESIDAESFGEKAARFVGKLASAIGHAASEILPAAADVVTAFISGLVGGGDGLESSTSDLQKGAEDLVDGLATGISGAADRIVAAVPELLQSLVTGMVEQLPYYLGLLVGKIGEIFKNLVSGEGALSNLFMGVLTGITGQADKAAEHFSKLAEKIDPNQNPDLMKAIVNFGVGMRLGFFTDEEIQEQANKLGEIGNAGTEAANKTGTAFQNADLSIDTEKPTKSLQEFVGIADQTASELFTSGVKGGENFDTGVVSGIDGGKGQIQTAANGIKDSVNVDLSSEGEKTGASYSQGLIRGMMSLADKVAATANHLAGIITNGTMNTLEVKSPSHVARRIAEFWDAGLIEGMREKMDDVRKQSEEIASSMIPHIDLPSVDYADMIAPKTMTYSATKTETQTDSKIDVLLTAINDLKDAILNQAIEMDGDVVAEKIDRRLGMTAAMKARV